MNLIGNNSCFLDTSIVIEAFRNTTTVLDKLTSFEDIFVSHIVLGELYFGAYRSADPAKHIQQIEFFVKNCTFISCNAMTSVFYGRTKAQLYAIGKQIPENDIWIAALAIQHALPLYTTDNHFSFLQPELELI